MAGRALLIGVLLGLTFLPMAASAKYSTQIVDARLIELADRDVLVMRGVDSLPDVNGYKRQPDTLALSFLLKRVGFDDLAEIPAGSTPLISRVAFDADDPSGTTITLYLAEAALLDPDYFRFTKPTRGVLVVEVFPQGGIKQQAGLLTDVDSLLPELTRSATGVAAVAASPATPTPEFDPDALGIPVVDLRDGDAQRVLGLAAATGLLDMNASASVLTENWGGLTVKPAGQSLVSWAGETPPDELYLAGTPAQIAEFLQRADAGLLSQVPTVAQFWAANMPGERIAPTMGGSVSNATRQRVKDDPAGGLYYADTRPQQRILSDVRVTLPAMSGMNLYDVINYLSLISGISIMLDPYLFDEPFGGPRPPKSPAPPAAADGGPGFRPAGEFDPQTPRSGGTVIGNFDNVPFDTALELILSTHQLVYAVLDSGSSGQSGSRYGKPVQTTPYTKPLILVTSRERLEQELPGQNEVDLYQLHYADPNQLTQILDQLGMMPGTDSGWYIYTGGGAGSGGDGGSGTGGGGRGGSGGGSGFSAGTPARATAQPGLLVYRGTSRAPVEAAVAEAVNAGAALIRVLLPPNDSGMQVTAFAR